jgi:hypothetical protein
MSTIAILRQLTSGLSGIRMPHDTFSMAEKIDVGPTLSFTGLAALKLTEHSE